MNKLLLPLILLLSVCISKAQTTLTAGDMAVIRINEDGIDGFSIVTLVNLEANTPFFVTEQGWRGASLRWQDNTEVHALFTTPAAYAAGTILHFDEETPNVLSVRVNSASTVVATLSATNFNYSGGDQVIIYQGTKQNPVFIAALNSDDSRANDLYGHTSDPTTKWASENAAVDGYMDGVQMSRQPGSLINTINCVALADKDFFERDNAYFNGRFSGTRAELLSEINDRSKWVFSDENSYSRSVFSSAFTVTAATPPTATNIDIEGPLRVGETLMGTYTYYDAESDAESGSIYKWYAADDAAGTGKTQINGANGNTYTLTSDQLGKYISFAVIPKNAKESGVESASNWLGPVEAKQVVSPYSQLYWPNYEDNSVESIELNGNGRATIVSDAASDPAYGAICVAVDAEGGRLYWFEDKTQTILRSDLDGSNRETFISNPGYATSLFFNPLDRKLYWPNYESNKIESVNTDGSGRTDVIVNAAEGTGYGPIGIALDPLRQVIYWSEDYQSTIRRANLDGSHTELFISDPGYAKSLYVDARNQKLYWPNYEANKIESINTDGSGRIDVITNAAPTINYGPIGITLDVLNERIYWYEDFSKRILRAYTDGTGRTPFIDNPGEATGIAIPYDYAYRCEDAQLAMSNLTTTLNHQEGEQSQYGLNCSSLIATLESLGEHPFKGLTTAKVWIENQQPAHFVKRHYQITPGSNGTGRITLYFTADEFAEFNALNDTKLPVDGNDNTGIANIRIEKRSGQSTDNSGKPDTYPGPTETINPDDESIFFDEWAQRWQISFDVSSFSGFFLKTQEAPLPVTLVDFNARKSENSVILQWKTTDAKDFSHFEIQRSDDGKQFGTIGSTPFITDRSSYAFSDMAVKATTYYRLKMIDFDGTYAFSKMVSVAADNRLVSAFPNPVKNVLTITSLTDIPTDVTLIGIDGRMRFHQLVTPKNGKIELALAEKVEAGVYILNLRSGETVSAQKIIVE